MRKKQKQIVLTNNRMDLEHQLNTFNDEMHQAKQQLENVDHQLNFFGSTSELKDEKKDVKMMIKWLNEQCNDVKSSLSSYNMEPILQ
jgi:chromosome segregation ATPase